jgi:hypothetical protein
MGIPAGPWYLDDMLIFTVNTHDMATGAATDADSDPTYRIYASELGTPILTGSMSKLDDTNTTGFYAEQVELSEGNGFNTGGRYSIYVSMIVDSVTFTESYNLKITENDSGLLNTIDGKADQLLVITDEVRSLILQTAVAGSTGNDDTHIQINNSFGWTDDDLNNLLIRISVDGAPHTRWITDFASGIATLHEALPAPVEEGDAYAIFAIRRDVSGGGGGGATAEDVWTYGTRTLTALDEDSTTIDIDGVVRSALGLASSNLDTQLGNLPTNADLTTALGDADDAVLAQIALVKTKTDSLTFTIAGQVDANIESVNGATVNGAGTEGDPWRP